MRKDKRQTDNDRKSTEREQQEYNDIDWEDLYPLPDLLIQEIRQWIVNRRKKLKK